ncbi:hypothetical protein MXB_305, partial [Myxobolus squamalis]
MLNTEITILKVDVERIQSEINSMVQKMKVKSSIDARKMKRRLIAAKFIDIRFWILILTHQYIFPYLTQGNRHPRINDRKKRKSAMRSNKNHYPPSFIGLVNPKDLYPGDLIGVHKDSYYIIEKLPVEIRYDSRVKSMEVDERPTEDYNDIGGLDKQIQELVEAIVLPMTHAEKFVKLGIEPPKGIVRVLLYGPPGTGKTLLARACAAQTKATYLKLAGPQLVQMFIGDGAKIVRDAFALAKEKAPTIIFIDELDAIGTKRFDSERTGDREVQRTMLELLNQLDGFTPNSDIKIIAATNRIDILDPAILRSGRLDAKIEFPSPTEEARITILQIHSRKMH